MPEIVQVTIPGNIFDYLDYLPPQRKLTIGARVRVKLRGKELVGLVMGQCQDDAITYKLQPLLEILDEQAILDEHMLKLAKWLGNYYQSPLSDVIKTMLPKKLRQGEICQLPQQIYYQRTSKSILELSKQAKQQLLLLQYCSDPSFKYSQAKLYRQGFKLTTLKPLLENGFLIKTSQDLLPQLKFHQHQVALELNDEQQLVIELVEPHLTSYKAFLLFGITGSGKTEVYFYLMQKVLEQGKQVLILVPEIGLTPQFLNRVEKRFAYKVAVLHSNLNDKERLTNWLWCKQNQVQILIGTRTAVFTPLPKLGLIIVDEEHDLSFKQQDGMRFSGRDVALKRGFDSKVPVILGSATPSIESLYNVEQDKYSLLTLNKRAVTNEKTYYRIIDLRNQKIIDGLCSQTIERIKVHLENKQQVLVFINRRGYAPILICHQCAWMADCKNCSAHLTVHEQDNKMICHHCGYKRRLAKHCDDCHSSELIPVGAGTQRLTSFLSGLFPNNKVLRVDRDTTRGKNTLKDTLAAIDQGEVDILVGTQLLAKGHHFKKLTLVVVVDADHGFFSQDFRAIERLGQVVTQVAGRAGREGGGEVIIQTHKVDNPLLNTLIQNGYHAFSKQLLKERQYYFWPPYTYLALCRAKGNYPERVINFFNKLKKILAQLNSNLTLLGPAPAPMEKKAGQYQLQLLIRSEQRAPLLRALKQLRLQLRSKEHQKLVSNLRFSIDVDPQDLS